MLKYLLHVQTQAHVQSRIIQTAMAPVVKEVTEEKIRKHLVLETPEDFTQIAVPYIESIKSNLKEGPLLSINPLGSSSP